MAVCGFFEFCEKAKKMIKEDAEYVKLFCKSSEYEECEDLFKEEKFKKELVSIKLL